MSSTAASACMPAVGGGCLASATPRATGRPARATSADIRVARQHRAGRGARKSGRLSVLCQESFSSNNRSTSRPETTDTFGHSQSSLSRRQRAETRPDSRATALSLRLGPDEALKQQRQSVLGEAASALASALGGAWSSYCRVLEEKPLPTKAIVMALGLALGDVFAQAVTTGTVGNLTRTLHMAVFGFAFQGPALHFLHGFLEKRVRPQAPNSTGAVLSKVSIDQGLFAPAAVAAFISFMQLASGNVSVGAVASALQSSLVPTLKANYLLWPAALLINYGLCPPQHRILFVNVVTVLWSAILSVVTA